MPEMRVTFHEELDALCAEVQKEGELVLRSLRASLNALETDDVELAGEVITFDDEIDQLYSDVGRGIESLLARQTPVAVDLRLVLALLHINLHLERMGDYCVTIAKLLRLAEGLPGPAENDRAARGDGRALRGDDPRRDAVVRRAGHRRRRPRSSSSTS